MNNENLNTNFYTNQHEFNNNIQNVSQGQISQNNNPKKGNKKPLIIGIVLGVVVLMLVIGLIICFGGISNSPKKIVKNYVNALIQKNYDSAFNYILLPENSFVDSDDYFEYIKSKDYFSTISSTTIDSLKESYVRELESEYKLTLKDSNNIKYHYNVQLQKDYKDEWKIVESSLYITDWAITMLTDTEFFIDDKKVDTSLISEKNGLKVKYVLPAIASTKKTFKLVNSLQTKEVEYTPLSSNSNEIMYLELTDENLTNKAFEYIKNTWNNMYNDYINGVDVSDVADKYFVDTMDIESVNTYYTKSFANLTQGSSGYKTIDYVLTEVVDNPNADNYVISGNTITINFGYKLTWTWSFNNDFRTMTRFSKIRLRLDGDSFKIYEVADDDLFQYSNQFTKKY